MEGRKVYFLDGPLAGQTKTINHSRLICFDWDYSDDLWPVPIQIEYSELVPGFMSVTYPPSSDPNT